MKSLMKWGLICAFAGGSWVGPALSRNLTAVAQQQDAQKQLTALIKKCDAAPPKNLIDALNCNDAKVIQKCQTLPKDEAARKKQADLVEACKRFGVLIRLQPIPVFTLINKDGSPILEKVQGKDKQGNAKTVSVGTFYLGQTEAEAKLKDVKKTNKDAQLNPISLKLAFQISEATQKQIAYQFVPTKQQTDHAKTILQQQGEKGDQFVGIPLFYALGGKDKEKGLLTITKGKQKAVPFYFDRSDLQTMLGQLKKQDASLSATTTVKVTTLAQVVDTLFKEDQPIILIPSNTTQKYLQQRQGAKK